MPRKQKPPLPFTATQASTKKRQQALIKAMKNAMSPNAPARGVGRPRKAKKAKELEDALITPVANGYVVKSSSTGKELFVFEDFDKMLEFLRAKLKPTSECSEFLDKV